MRHWNREVKSNLGLGLAVTIGFILFTPWPTQILELPLIQSEAPSPSEVIIVLGASTRKGPDPLPPQAKQRVSKGVQLWQAEIAPTMIVAGGRSPVTGLVESVMMKQYAVGLDVPPDAVIEENTSRDTRQNAENSLRIMAEQDWDTAVVVTSSYHTWRACRVFRKLEADVRCVAAPLEPGATVYDRWINFRGVVREYGAIVYYALQGFL